VDCFTLRKLIFERNTFLPDFNPQTRITILATYSFINSSHHYVLPKPFVLILIETRFSWNYFSTQDHTHTAHTGLTHTHTHTHSSCSKFVGSCLHNIVHTRFSNHNTGKTNRIILVHVSRESHTFICIYMYFQFIFYCAH